MRRWQIRVLERLGVLHIEEAPKTPEMDRPVFDVEEYRRAKRAAHEARAAERLAEDKRREAEENAVMTERDIRRLTYQLFIAYPSHGLPNDEAGLEAVIVQLYRRASTYVNFL
jgi:hypothetical protein